MCVHAWRCPAAAAFGSASSRSSIAAGSSNALAHLVVDVHVPHRCRATARGSAAPAGTRASRFTTAAALTSALSFRNGAEPCPGVPRHPQAPPRDALLGHGHRDHRVVLAAVVQPAVLGQHVVDSDRVAVFVGHPPGAVGTARFLVGDREEHQVATGPEPAVDQVAERHGHRCGHVEHVHCAAAPHLLDPFGVPHDLGRERVAIPSGRVDRDHVGVPHQAQAVSAGIVPGQPGDERGPPRHRLPPLDVDARALDERLEHVCVAASPRRSPACRRSRSGCGSTSGAAQRSCPRIVQDTTMGHLPRGSASRWSGSPWQPCGHDRHRCDRGRSPPARGGAGDAPGRGRSTAILPWPTPRRSVPPTATR